MINIFYISYLLPDGAGDMKGRNAMNFSCEKALLQGAISTAGRTVASKSSIAALEGVLVEARDGKLTLTGYNLETGIETAVEAQVAEEGSIVLSPRLFGDIVRNLADDVVTCVSNNLNVNIKCGMSDYNILGIPADEFPELPAVDDGNGFLIPQGKLKAMISQTIFAVSDNESRPIHTGSLFETEGEVLTMVAVDGYRLALRREKLASTCVRGPGRGAAGSGKDLHRLRRGGVGDPGGAAYPVSDREYGADRAAAGGRISQLQADDTAAERGPGIR